MTRRAGRARRPRHGVRAVEVVPDRLYAACKEGFHELGLSLRTYPAHRLGQLLLARVSRSRGEEIDDGQQDGAVKTVQAKGIYVVNAALNLRDAPDLASGKVVGQLAKGTRVEVVEMSYLIFPVQGMRAAWFRIKQPAGWVYGYYLDPSSEMPPPTPRLER